MANVVFQAYQAKGNREDLTDIIKNISPVETWVTSNSGDATAAAVYHQWQTDALRAPTANAVIEGAAVDSAAITPTVLSGNYVQNVRREWTISDIQEQVSKAGRKSEDGYQTENKLKELANDIEYAICINSAAASGASGTARQTNGLIGFITSNVTTGSGVSGITGVASNIETLFNDNLQLIWAAGGKPSTVLVGGALKRKISAFTGNNTRFNTMTESEVNQAVRVYDSDFGLVKFRTHYVMNAAASGTALVMGDMSLIRTAWLARVKKEKIARLGSASTYFAEGSFALEVGSEKGIGKITLT